MFPCSTLDVSCVSPAASSCFEISRDLAFNIVSFLYRDRFVSLGRFAIISLVYLPQRCLSSSSFLFTLSLVLISRCLTLATKLLLYSVPDLYFQLQTLDFSSQLFVFNSQPWISVPNHVFQFSTLYFTVPNPSFSVPNPGFQFPIRDVNAFMYGLRVWIQKHR